MKFVNNEYVCITSDNSIIFWKKYSNSEVFYTVIEIDETKNINGLWELGAMYIVKFGDDWIKPYCYSIKNKKEIKRLDKKRFLLGIC